MGKRVKLLDCTLRDGAYIVDAKFGESAIKGLISKLQSANVDVIECGWLKNDEHKIGTSFYHVPQDLKYYVSEKKPDVCYTVMIDWDRYNLEYLPVCDNSSIDAIRVVFPHEKYKEGIEVGRIIKEKGYQVFYQAANTLAYTNEELIELAKEVNKVNPVSLSVVDTFGAMFEEDLERIVTVLEQHLNPEIKLGFHSHNNQQLSFALSMHFVKILLEGDRGIIVDSSLCGMGRGAGNATTELMANYLNTKCSGNYDMDAIMDAIDIYMTGFLEKYSWGYSTPNFIAGMYCCHVNNIAYLSNNHRTNARDMRNIIASLSEDERKKYDYDLLEEKYIENQSRIVDDTETLSLLSKEFSKTEILLIAPGKSILLKHREIVEYIIQKSPIVIAVNALLPEYQYDYLFLTNHARYEYAKETRKEQFSNCKKILLSNIKTNGDDSELIVGFNRAIKRGWEHFDNAVICCLRLMDRLGVKKVVLAGFDGFKHEYNESYADEFLPTLNPGNKWDDLNVEIKDMLNDVKAMTEGKMEIEFLTESIYNK